MKLNLDKYNFKKTEKDLWVGWHDYLLTDINPEYGFFLKATLHYPRKAWLESKGDIEHRMFKIILHRYYSYERIEEFLKDRESEVVYKGLIENNEDLDFLLHKLGILDKEK